MTDRDEWDYGPFKVGDVVEGYGFIFDIYSNGMLCTIIGGLHHREMTYWSGDESNNAYKVHWSDGKITAAEPNNLRRKKPPMTGLENVLSMFDKQPDRVKELA